MTPSPDRLGRPPLDNEDEETIVSEKGNPGGVQRGEVCSYCPELQAKMADNNALLHEQQRRLDRIETKDDAASAAAAEAHRTAAEQRDILREVVAKFAEQGTELAVLKSRLSLWAAFVAAVVSSAVAWIISSVHKQ